MSVSPETPAQSLEAAQAAIREQRPAEAVPIVEAITAANPENYDAWQTLAVAYAQSGRQPESVRAFNQCVKLRPNLPQPHFNLAQALLSGGEREKARAELELCLSVDPQYIKASQALSQLGQAPAAPTLGVPGIGGSGEYTGGGLAAGYGAPQGPMIGQMPLQGPMMGQMPPSFTPGQAAAGQAPQFTPQFNPQFTPGATGLAGGQIPSPAAGVYQPTMFQSNSRPIELPGSAKGWAISAIVLGSLIALFMLPQIPRTIITLAIACCYVAGGIGVLKGGNWGRIMLMVCSVLGIVGGVLIGLGGVLLGPVFQQAMNRAAMSGSPGNPLGPQLAQMQLGAPVLVGFCFTFALIFIGYNLPLFLNMKSEHTSAALR